MNMFARFDENPAMTLGVIKETKCYGRTDGRTHGRTDARTDNVKTVYPLQTKFAGGIMTKLECPQMQTDRGWPFWRPSWLSFIRQYPQLILRKSLMKVMHI